MMAVVVLLAGCGVSPGPPGPPSTPGRDLVVWLADLEDRAGGVIHARNDSESIQRVVSISLSDCFNVDLACGTHPVDVVVCPGQTRQVLVVRPRTAEHGEGFLFNWRFTARRYERGEPVVGAECEEGGAP
jgi:hypothetical protein